jgi:ABC-type polysaccharide/polyol phosphate export permease
MTAIPDNLRSLFELNPVAWGAESLRALLLEGRVLNLADWALHLVVSMILLSAAVWVFRQLEEGFADVL